MRPCVKFVAAAACELFRCPAVDPAGGGTGSLLPPNPPLAGTLHMPLPAGTSPLYVFGAVFPNGAPADERVVYGVFSTIFWTLTAIGER